MSYRLLVVDDFEPWRRHVRSVLQHSATWQLVGEASDGAEAVQQALALRPDVILLDISLPTMDGIQVAERVLARDRDVRILFVSEFRSWGIVEAALRTGAYGYVVKSDAARELMPATKAIAEGKRFISARFAGRPIDPTIEQVPWEARRHEAGFYSDDTLLLDDYARFAEAALQAGDSVLVIDSRRAQLQARMELRGTDIDRAIKDGRYLSMDVASGCAGFLVDGWPNEARFWDASASLIMKAARASKSEHPRVAACGECSPTLWREGRGDAAVRLEQLWDELARTFQLDVLCGYSMPRGDEPEIFQRICAAHSAVHSR